MLALACLLASIAVSATLVAPLAHDVPTPLAFGRAVLAVGILLALCWLGSALGLEILRMTRAGPTDRLERSLYAFGLGLGGLGLLVFGLGLLGLYDVRFITAGLGILAIVLRHALAQVAADSIKLAQSYPERRREFGQTLPGRLAVQLGELTLAAAVIRALAPPTGYDGLTYHLTAPSEFLRLGRFAVLPDLPHANMPFIPQMLNLVGLAYGSYEIAAVLNVTFAGTLAVLTWSLARRLFGSYVAWISALAFLSSTVLTTHGAQPNVDYVWAFFDVLAVYGVATWMQTGQRTWLLLSGLALGLALGSKYLSLITAVAIAVVVAIVVIRSKPVDWMRLAQSFALIGLPALVVGGPWYTKNWVWLGNPLWTVFSGGSALQNAQYFGSNMTHGRGLADLLSVPWNLFRGDIEMSLSAPPLLLLLLPLYAVTRKNTVATFFVALGALHLAVWTQGMQTVRYLLPTFAPLCIVTGQLLVGSGDSPIRTIARRMAPWLLSLSLAWAACAGFVLLLAERPWMPLLGLESRDDYIQRVTPEFAAIRYLNEHRAEVGRVLMAGDSRVFYLEAPTTAIHTLDSEVFFKSTPQEDLAVLRSRGVTHVLLSTNQFNWLASYDPEHRLDSWRAHFESVRAMGLTTEFDSPWARVYRIAAGETAERTMP